MALLCRRATEKQFAMFEQNIAVITFHGIATLCQSPDWKWGYHATLRYLVIFEALGVFTRLRRNRKTEIHIPLGVRQEPLNRAGLLQSLDDLQKKKPKKHEYKDKKLVQLIGRVRSHIEIYGLGEVGDSEHRQRVSIDQARFVLLQERITSVMRAEHIPLAKCKRIAQWMCSDQIPELLRDYISADLLFHDQGEQQGDSENRGQERTGRYQCSLGDSKDLTVLTGDYSEGASQNGVGDYEYPFFALQLAHSSEISAQNRPQKTQQVSNSVASTLTKQSKVSAPAPSEALENKVGDSEECLSSNISILNNNISNKDGNDIEKAPVVVSSESPNTSILAEATWIAIELDGEESLKFNRGRGWIGAYKKKLEENPYLVRASMIDMFMQRFFPDWQGPPQGRGGPWFNRAYKAYILQEVSVSPEVESWARSLYSYKQIKKALFLERQRQEEEIKEIQRRSPFATETFQRPFADCVKGYGLLRGGQASTPASEVYHDPFPDEETPASQPGEYDGDEMELGAVVEMEDGTHLSLEEYEQLEARALEEECHRVKTLVSDPSLADLLGDYVEQWGVAGQASLPAPILSDLQHVQAILDPERYMVDVQFTGRDSCVIKVQSNDDPTNVCMLANSEQTQVFLRRFGDALPVLLSDNLQRLRAILDPDLYLAEVLLTLDGPYTIRVRARTNPSNACLLKGLGQVRVFIDWFTHLPAEVLDDQQHLRAILNPEQYTVGVQLTPANRYVILIWDNNDPTNDRPLEGPEQTREFINWFTQEEPTDPALPGEVCNVHKRADDM